MRVSAPSSSPTGRKGVHTAAEAERAWLCTILPSARKANASIAPLSPTGVYTSSRPHIPVASVLAAGSGDGDGDGSGEAWTASAWIEKEDSTREGRGRTATAGAEARKPSIFFARD